MLKTFWTIGLKNVVMQNFLGKDNKVEPLHQSLICCSTQMWNMLE